MRMQCAMTEATEPIDDREPTESELPRAGIHALIQALRRVGTARFLRQHDHGRATTQLNTIVFQEIRQWTN
jgi:hypothetical protein